MTNIELQLWIRNMSDTCKAFMAQHKDIDIWFLVDNAYGCMRLLMIDREKPDNCIERVHSIEQMTQATFDIVLYDLEKMRERLMNYD